MITFEKLRELERSEKDNNKIQPLPENLKKDISEYISIKKNDVLEVENVKNSVKRLFEIRERKILEAVVFSVRTNLPVENLTKEEFIFFEEVKEKLKAFRTAFMSGLDKDVETAKAKKQYKALADMPEFVGPDGKTYSLTKDQTLDLPEQIAQLLTKKKLIKAF